MRLSRKLLCGYPKARGDRPAHCRVASGERRGRGYLRVYELVWALDTRYPDESPHEKLAAAEAALCRLVQFGLVALYTGDPDATGEPPLTEEEALAAMAAPSFWIPASDTSERVAHWFVATNAGQQAHSACKFKSL